MLLLQTQDLPCGELGLNTTSKGHLRCCLPGFRESTHRDDSCHEETEFVSRSTLPRILSSCDILVPPRGPSIYCYRYAAIGATRMLERTLQRSEVIPEWGNSRTCNLDWMVI